MKTKEGLGEKIKDFQFCFDLGRAYGATQLLLDNSPKVSQKIARISEIIDAFGLLAIFFLLYLCFGQNQLFGRRFAIRSVF